MTLLPIVERELRVAARKRSTFWLRSVAGVIALVIGIACLSLFTLGGLGSSGPGGMVFGAIMWLFLCAALAAGLFFSFHCPPGEKRGGTLGFFFFSYLRWVDRAPGQQPAAPLRRF